MNEINGTVEREVIKVLSGMQSMTKAYCNALIYTAAVYGKTMGGMADLSNFLHGYWEIELPRHVRHRDDVA